MKRSEIFMKVTTVRVSLLKFYQCILTFTMSLSLRLWLHIGNKQLYRLAVWITIGGGNCVVPCIHNINSS